MTRDGGLRMTSTTQIMTTNAILRAGRAKMPTPQQWTRGCSARDALGLMIRAESPDAIAFCMAGAIYAVSPSTNAYLLARMALIVVTKTVNVSSWNDNPGRTHAEVIAVYDAAIAATEVGGPAV
jgi:hypothetical protein